MVVLRAQIQNVNINSADINTAFAIAIVAMLVPTRWESATSSNGRAGIRDA